MKVRITELLQEAGYTQKQLASMVGVTEAAMSRYINGEREPRGVVLSNLAVALNTTTDYLLSGRKDENSFEELYKLVARGANNMTMEEKMRLVELLVRNV